CHFLDIQTHHMTTFGGQPVGDGSANALCCAGNNGARTRQPLRDGTRLSGNGIVCWCHETTAPAGGLPRSLPRRPSTGTGAGVPARRGARWVGRAAPVHRLPVVRGPATTFSKCRLHAVPWHAAVQQFSGL